MTFGSRSGRKLTEGPRLFLNTSLGLDAVSFISSKINLSLCRYYPDSLLYLDISFDHICGAEKEKKHSGIYCKSYSGQ